MVRIAFAKPIPLLGEEELGSIKPGCKVKVQLSDGYKGRLNETLVMEVKSSDESMLECCFLYRESLSRFDDKNWLNTSPFDTSTVQISKDMVFAIDLD